MTRFLSLFILTALLSACGTLPQSGNTTLDAGQHWRLEGKLGITTPKESVSGFVSWKQSNQQYLINVSGPLGSGAIEIEGTPEMITLRQGNREISSESPEALIYDQLGWFFPVRHLQYWVQGQASPYAPVDKQTSTGHRLEHLWQDNWEVEYFRWDEYHQLPSKIRISQGDWRFMLVIKQWNQG